MPSRSLSAESTLLIEGPASFRLDEGEAICLGAPLQTGNWSVVLGDRQLPVETANGCLLNVRLGSGGKFKEIKGSTTPTGWEEASTIVRQAPGVIVVLGGVDSGKSTLCTLLANECFRHGLGVRIIDGDVGQADIGPPTTISASLLREHVFSLQELKPDTAFFMGDTSPSFIPEKLWKGLLRLRDIAPGQSQVTIVNTDGWIQGDEAFRYKVQLLKEIGPNLVLGIGSDSELDRIIEQQRSTSLKLSRSLYAKTRTREERKRAREYGYKRFLDQAKRVVIPVRDVTLRRFNSYHQMKINEDENIRGVLAGLLDEGERLLAISRVESLRNGMITAKTLLEDSPRIVELGSLLLSSSYEELGYDS